MSNGKAAGQALISAVNMTKNKVIQFLSMQGASDQELERWRKSGIKDWQIRRHHVKRLVAKKSKRFQEIGEVRSIDEASQS